MCKRVEDYPDFDVLLPLLESYIFHLKVIADWGDEPLTDGFIIGGFCRLVSEELPRLLRLLNEQDAKRATGEPEQKPAAERKP